MERETQQQEKSFGAQEVAVGGRERERERERESMTFYNLIFCKLGLFDLYTLA